MGVFMCTLEPSLNFFISPPESVTNQSWVYPLEKSTAWAV